MTTADGMQPAFTGRHPKPFLISDLYRVDTETSEVNADIARSFFEVCYTPVTFMTTTNGMYLIFFSEESADVRSFPIFSDFYRLFMVSIKPILLSALAVLLH